MAEQSATFDGLPERQLVISIRSSEVTRIDIPNYPLITIETEEELDGDSLTYIMLSIPAAVSSVAFTLKAINEGIEQFEKLAQKLRKMKAHAEIKDGQQYRQLEGMTQAEVASLVRAEGRDG